MSAPQTLRESLTGLGRNCLAHRCAAFRIDEDRLDDPAVATKAALRALGRRIVGLNEEIWLADRRLKTLTTRTAPRTSELFGVGVEVAGQLLVSAGDNPERLRNEAAFAHLCATAPIPASSGRTDRHRLNRGGDRGANNALYMAVVTRMRYHEQTRAYVARRTAQGLSKSDIIRCLKRYVVREVYTAVLADFTALHAA